LFSGATPGQSFDTSFRIRQPQCQHPEGDLILSVNGTAISSPTDMNNRVERLAGQKIEVNLLRDRMPHNLEVQL